MTGIRGIPEALRDVVIAVVKGGREEEGREGEEGEMKRTDKTKSNLTGEAVRVLPPSPPLPLPPSPSAVRVYIQHVQYPVYLFCYQFNFSLTSFQLTLSLPLPPLPVPPSSDPLNLIPTMTLDLEQYSLFLSVSIPHITTTTYCTLCGRIKGTTSALSVIQHMVYMRHALYSTARDNCDSFSLSYSW